MELAGMDHFMGAGGFLVVVLLLRLAVLGGDEDCNIVHTLNSVAKVCETTKLR